MEPGTMTREQIAETLVSILDGLNELEGRFDGHIQYHNVLVAVECSNAGGDLGVYLRVADGRVMRVFDLLAAATRTTYVQGVEAALEAAKDES